jgi:hypothetical protein
MYYMTALYGLTCKPCDNFGEHSVRCYIEAAPQILRVCVYSDKEKSSVAERLVPRGYQAYCLTFTRDSLKETDKEIENLVVA